MLTSFAAADSVTLRLIYDARVGYPLTDFLFLLPLAGAIGAYWKFRDSGGMAAIVESGSREATLGLLGTIAGAIVTLGTCWMFLLPDLALRRALTAERFELREGVVRHYHPVGFFEHDTESWWLVTTSDSFPYSYGPAVADPGFGRVGLLAEGAWVRVWDVDGKIGRLEASR